MKDKKRAGAMRQRHDEAFKEEAERWNALSPMRCGDAAPKPRVRDNALHHDRNESA